MSECGKVPLQADHFELPLVFFSGIHANLRRLLVLTGPVPAPDSFPQYRDFSSTPLTLLGRIYVSIHTPTFGAVDCR